MKIVVCENPQALGRQAGAHLAEALSAAIAARGEARLALSTGASQFETIAALAQSDVDFSKVTMFHLDEYVGLPETDYASFRKYLKERFANLVPLKKAYFVSGEGDVQANIEALSRAIGEAPIDVGAIGIGENAHIAFNDPPADFGTQAAYKVVDLDERCRRQQVGEGWFPSFDAVPRQAITMTVAQIMRCRTIVSAVPHAEKAGAIRQTLEAKETTPLIPATRLREHPDITLYLDTASASLTDPAYLSGR